MANRFSKQDWQKIRAEFDANKHAYGCPERRDGSVLLASFNIRELSGVGHRSAREWQFLADCLRPFDLISVQEVGKNLGGMRKLMSLLGDEYALALSDVTGEHPGTWGNPERLGFLYRTSVVQRRELASDISYDRTMVLNLLADNLEAFHDSLKDYAEERSQWKQGEGSKPKLDRVKLPVFLTFVRQPYCVAFDIPGASGSEPLSFVAVDAHLYYGEQSDVQPRRQEIGALIDYIRASLGANKYLYAKNMILMGDLNFDHDEPDDRQWSDSFLKAYNLASGKDGRVNFPFLDEHREVAGLRHKKAIFRTNARENQTYDQIGLFGEDDWVWSFDQNELLPAQDDGLGPDFGMFNFQDLFAQALFGQSSDEIEDDERKSLWARSEYKISDHMPIWVRLPLPG